MTLVILIFLGILSLLALGPVLLRQRSKFFGVSEGVEDRELLASAEKELSESELEKDHRVIVAQLTSDKGYNLADAQKVADFLISNGISATVETNPLVGGLVFYNVLVPKDEVVEAENYLDRL